MRVADYYRAMYVFLITNFHLILLSLTKEESAILRKLLVFYKQYDELSLEKEIEKLENDGKNLHMAVIEYEEMQKETSKNDKVICETMLWMVQYIENFMYLQEKFTPLIFNFK